MSTNKSILHGHYNHVNNYVLSRCPFEGAKSLGSMVLVKSLHKLAGKDKRFGYLVSDPLKQDAVANAVYPVSLSSFSSPVLGCWVHVLFCIHLLGI